MNQIAGFWIMPGALAFSWSGFFRMVAQRAGDRISAIRSDNAMAETIVTENWR